MTLFLTAKEEQYKNKSSFRALPQDTLPTGWYRSFKHQKLQPNSPVPSVALFAAKRYWSQMLTVLIECHNDEVELAQTLSALVPGAVEGLVRDVIVLDHGSSDGTSKVADAAGCTFLTHWNLHEVVNSARGEWLLLLEPGARPHNGWVDAVAEYVALNKAPARFSGSRNHRRPFHQRILRRRAALEDGLLVSKAQASALVRPGMRLDQIATGVATRKLVAELVPAWVVRAMRQKVGA